ncbi:MAG: PAS domain S-box protein [Symploca sp. SIO2C1]|nr:PAS domain S-box protein [Symploca sp. SIO2C1]
MNSNLPSLSVADILLVDDQPQNLRLLTTMLSERGYKVRKAINGTLALNAVQLNKPDLIVLDIKMPELNGYEVCQRLKTNQQTADIPVIFMSALEEVWDKVKAFEVGGVDYISKPFQVQEVLARIENQLTIYRQKKQLEQQQKQLASQNAQLQLLLTTTKAIHEASDFHSALEATLCQVCEKIGWDFGEFWIPNQETTVLEYGPGWYARDESFEEFRHKSELLRFSTNKGILRQIWLSKQPYWFTDVSVEPCRVFLRSQFAKEIGLKACLGVPIILNEQVLAILVFFKREASPREERLIELVSALASQLSSLIGRKRSESALRESQQQLAAMAANIPGTVYRGVVHADGKISFVYISDGERELTGLVPDEIIVAPELYLQAIHPEDRANFEESLRTSVQTLEPSNYEYRIVSTSGEVKWVRDSTRYSCLDNGDVIVDGVALDISDRRQSEERLRLLDRAIAASSNGIIITDPLQPDNPVIYANPGFERITGYSINEVIGKNCRFLQGKETTQAALEELWTALKEERECHVTLRNFRKDGTLFWNELSISPVRDVSGKLTHYIGIQTDITELQQAKAALLESEARYRAAAEGSLDAFFIFQSLRDLTGDIIDFTFIDVNSRGEQMISLSKDQIIGKRLCKLLPINLTAGFFDKYVRVVETKEVLEEEFSISTPEVTAEWLHHMVVPLADGIAITTKDITERKQAEAALQKLSEQEREKAQQLEKTLKELQDTQAQLVQQENMASLGQLVAGVAHEINNPISFIYGNIYPASEYIQDLLHLLQLYQQHYPQPVPEITEELHNIELDFIIEDFPKLLASMREGANRISEIVLSLKNFSNLEKKERKRVDIHQGINNTLLLLQHRFKHQPVGVEFELIKEYGNLPLVECYPSQLNQVFMNIISNGIDALESDSRTLLGRITISTETLDPDRVAIRIANNGLGMTPEVRNRIFDPFFSTKPVGTGTGLGLAISYQIVVGKHQGMLTCLSEPEMGTEFWIELPINQS